MALAAAGGPVAQAIAATAVGVASLSTTSTFLRAITATAVGVALLDRVVTFVRSLAAVAAGTAVVGRGVTFARTLAAAAAGVAVLTTSLIKAAVTKIRRSRIGGLVVNPGTLLRRR